MHHEKPVLGLFITQAIYFHQGKSLRQLTDYCNGNTEISLDYSTQTSIQSQGTHPLKENAVIRSRMCLNTTLHLRGIGNTSTFLPCFFFFFLSLISSKYNSRRNQRWKCKVINCFAKDTAVLKIFLSRCLFCRAQ